MKCNKRIHLQTPAFIILAQLQNSITENEVLFNEEGDEVSKRPWFLSGGEQRPWRHDPLAKLFPEDAPGDDR